MEKAIQFISSSAYVVSRCKTVFRENGFDFPIAQVKFNNLEAFVSDALVDGAKVFVGRGKTAALLKKMNLDVVSLRFTYYDFFNAMQRAQKISNKIAILGYKDSWSFAIKPYYELLDKPLFVNLEDSSELDGAIRYLKAKGIGAIICGHTAREIAQRYDMPTVQIGLESSSVIDSIEEARYLLQIKIQRSSHEELLGAIFNNAVESVISVDETGKITNANQNALHIMGKDCIYGNIADYISDPALLPGGHRSIRLRHELCKVNNVLCTINISSFIDLEQHTITIYFFQPIAQVQSLEQDIRKKQLLQGNVAKAHFSNITGKSTALVSTVDLAKRFAQSDSTILIHGEVGTGKEIFAQSIHNYSSRFSEPFVTVNCEALSPEILERELFGYAKSAFHESGAEAVPGLFETADGGSIFFDEICELPLEIQAKLLRVIQEGEVRRIGSSDVIRVNVRIIAATRQNIFKLVQEKKFREDLYYRLAVLEFTIPPLRKRREDILPIAESLLKELSAGSGYDQKRLDPQAENLIASMEWSGNIRQLRNILERVSVMSDSPVITEKLLQSVCEGASVNIIPNLIRKVGDQERERILRVLQEEGGNRNRAAERLGISKTTLWRRISAIKAADPDCFKFI